MPYSNDLIASGRRILGGARGRPRASDCNRAVSSAYYAVFDCLCRGVATKIVGTLPKSKIPTPTWVKVYRSIDHLRARDEFQRIVRAGEGNSDELKKFAALFVALQIARASADYDPSKAFKKNEARSLLDDSELAIKLFDSLSKDEFASLVVALVVKTAQRSEK